jgi:hypothetical protein
MVYTASCELVIGSREEVAITRPSSVQELIEAIDKLVKALIRYLLMIPVR